MSVLRQIGFINGVEYYKRFIKFICSLLLLISDVMMFQEQYEFIYRAAARSLTWKPSSQPTVGVKSETPSSDPVYINTTNISNGGVSGSHIYANTSAIANSNTIKSIQARSRATMVPTENYYMNCQTNSDWL